ncbi:centromere-associated protein E isoform X7 [Hippoglossus stenolepis]|uniref:centromere-associated protein E isoform X7 n=1 Tax=Hippoglossus stenolepis TaxID=195615 RepID=UPI001FAFE9DA|nr:centromere-associated protein E isoform X7 [Hippoglossus stenolepis]
MTEESAVKVCVRVRPLIAREESTASGNAEPVQLFWKTDKKSIHQIDDGNSTKTFSFDRVFTAEETTNQLYQDIAKPLVVSTVEGYNGTIFAYGQTSSGKTFTMMGSDQIPGVTPLAMEDVFQTIKNCPKKEFLLRVSYMEIYNETVTDLLVDSWKRKPLEVRETINKNIYVADLSEELVTSPAQALAWIWKGEKNRHYGKTKMNQRSSRSHTIFRMILESRERTDLASGENADGAIIVSHLNLVDLAGSERASQTGAEGTRFKEGCNINRSLFTLGQVIKKVTEESQKGFTNYRDSKLTRILQNSLGGNAKTVIICTITPVTLDETLSTLQFASTAKKMKNDPHVTEVSDDGALLKRYRNEIVDLKRRLHEVSSETQTTVTEKEVLSQLLQEKDHLQREQEDRIRNLTKLLVTSSNLVPVKKMPKRRVTWGGKMLRLATSSACGGSSNLSFAEAFTRKRKADRSCLMELTEDDEEFDAHWEIPDEPSDDMEMSHSSVTVQSFGDSPKDYTSPDWMHALSGKVSNLELQLEMESQQKEEAMTKVEKFEGRVAELELQLQTEAQQKQEALEKVQTTEKRAAELEQQQQSKALEATEKVLMLELRVADLERQLEEQNHGQTANEQIRKEFAETIQLCETLASEKDMVVAERDYLKEELGMFIEQTEHLENDKAALSQELEEKRETDEFKSLEEEFKKEQELEVQNEISSYKKVIESTKVKCQELQNKVDTLSEEIQKKTESAEQLQRMSGEDLVQELAKLRRSLDDAEGVSRDTKKEWAVLRSQNIALEEMKVTLTLNLEKMEAQVNSLRSHLEIEKSRYRKMESDLQKELTVTFDENNKLTDLLDGKVPKDFLSPDLIDRVEFERKVATLSEELTASRKAEGSLRAQLEELASCPTQEQLEESDQQRALLVERLNEMQQLIKHLEKKLADSEVSRTSMEEIGKELQEQQKQQTKVLQYVRAEKEALLSEQKAEAQSSAEEMDQLLSTLTSVTAERDQLKMDLQENVEMTIENQEELRTALEKNREQKELLSHLETLQTTKEDGALSEMSAQLEARQKHLEESDQQRALLVERLNEMQQLMKHYEKKLADSEVSRTSKEEIGKELQEQQKQQTKVLQYVRAEKEALLSEQKAEAQSSAEEMDQLLSTLTSVTAERDQLKMDLQENVEMTIENQEELRTALEKNREQKELLSHLETLQTTKEDGALSEMSAQLEARQKHIKTLTEQVENAEKERKALLFERKDSFPSSSEEKEKLLCRVMSVSEESDQLQETLQELRQEKQQLRAELGDKMDALQCEINTLTKKLESTETERDSLLCEKDASFQSSSVEKEKLMCRVTSLCEERDQLQETLQELRQEKQQFRAELEDKMETLQCEMKTLTEKLESTETERDSLLCEKEASFQSSSEEKEKLLCRVTSLCEERDQLQETLQELRQQKQQLKAELEDQMETLQCEMKTLTERDSLLCEKEASFQSSSVEKEKLMCRVTSLCEERDQLKETLQELRQEKQQFRAELEDQMETLQCEVKTLKEKMKSTQTERDNLLCEKEASFQSSSDEKVLCRVTSLCEERDQLQETLQELRQENQQLRAELEDKMTTMQCEVKTLTEKVKSTDKKRDSLLCEKEASFQISSEEKEKLICRVTSLCEERDQLQETLQELRQEKQQLRTELEDKMKTLQCELLSEDRGSTGVDVTVSSRLNDSTRQLQETFRGFQHFIDTCSKYISTPMDKVLRVQSALNHGYLTSLPKATMSAYTAICQLGLETVQTLGNIVVCLQVKAQDCRNRFEELVKKDLSVFEERRLQDVLMCRVQAPILSVKDEDFHTVWEHRLADLLDKRQLYQQKMSIILEKFLDNVASHPNELSAEITERERFKEQLQGAISAQPISFSELDSILSCELNRRAALAHSKKMILQGITAEQSVLSEELKLLEAQARFQLREEKSKSSTLLQAIEGAPLKSEISLLKDNQNLLTQLMQTEEKVKALHVQNEQLEEAQIKAKNGLSSHKQATQLLQTELQDSCAQTDEKEKTIQTLRGKLQESEKRASPSAAELENLQTKLFKMEVELSSASDKHQQEIQRMSTVLNVKEESLRNLKEALRRIQQQGEESFLQGEDLHTKLTNPRGLVIKSSILLDKAKLEKEVKQLCLKITELECLVSTQQTEISKWKSRAINLKAKSKVEVDKPSSPCTTTKRGPQETSDSSSFLSSPKKFLVTSRKILDSPRKVMDFPKVYQLDSPKSRFFDVGGSSDLLSRTCPKQFFDNSSLGTIPEVSHVPDTPDAERDAAAGLDAARKDEWWPQSPKQEDMCKTQ